MFRKKDLVIDPRVIFNHEPYVKKRKTGNMGVGNGCPAPESLVRGFLERYEKERAGAFHNVRARLLLIPPHGSWSEFLVRLFLNRKVMNVLQKNFNKMNERQIAKAFWFLANPSQLVHVWTVYETVSPAPYPEHSVVCPLVLCTAAGSEYKAVWKEFWKLLAEYVETLPAVRNPECETSVIKRLTDTNMIVPKVCFIG